MTVDGERVGRLGQLGDLTPLYKEPLRGEVVFPESPASWTMARSRPAETLSPVSRYAENGAPKRPERGYPEKQALCSAVAPTVWTALDLKGVHRLAPRCDARHLAQASAALAASAEEANVELTSGHRFASFTDPERARS